MKSFFSKSIKENYDLDSEIDKAFALLEGEIMSYDEPFGGACGSSNKKYYSASTAKILNNKNKEFKIVFGGWLTNDDKDKIGVDYIKVIDMSITYDKTKTNKENGIFAVGDKTRV